MIEKHISALLYRYQCVTVPGFGAFLTEIQPSYLDAASHTFYPPKKLVSFNANVKNNDGLLANHIASQEKISYAEAVNAIAATTDIWKHALNGANTIYLKNLGEILLNAEGNMVFTPDVPVNYLTQSFGLSMVVSPAVKREVYKAEVEALEEKAPIIFTPERRRSYSYLKYAAIFVAAIGFGLTGFKTYNDNRVAQQTLAVQQKVQQRVQQQIQEATFFIDNPLPAAVTLPLKEAVKEKLSYHVVAGAYQSEANAQKAVDQLTAKGYKARKLQANKYGLYPVLYGSFANHTDAKQSMREIHKNGDKEAWILVQEL
ncbi:SPOR domain-containing protein [Flavobacterium sp. Sd200]|nr:SPOR domain-containing protein [Flavobacterium sp. Sd200]